jgi:hypothetical protein
MKKDNFRTKLFDISQEKYKSVGTDKIKTTDVNILLNRVKISKKIEFKKRIIFSSLLLLFTIFVGVFFLLQ